LGKLPPEQGLQFFRTLETAVSAAVFVLSLWMPPPFAAVAAAAAACCNVYAFDSTLASLCQLVSDCQHIRARFCGQVCHDNSSDVHVAFVIIAATSGITVTTAVGTAHAY